MKLRFWMVCDCVNNREILQDSAENAYDYCCQVLKEAKLANEELRTQFLADLTTSYAKNKNLFGIEDVLEVEMEEY